MEDIKFDGDGKKLTGSLMDDAMPERSNQRKRGEEQSVPQHQALGVKGAGEAGCVGDMTRVGQCVGLPRALPLGVRQIEMPATRKKAPLGAQLRDGNAK